MRQFVGSVRDESTVRDLLVSVAPAAGAHGRPRGRRRGAGDDGARRRADPARLRAGARRLGRRRRLRGRGGLGRRAARRRSGTPWERAQWRAVRTLSGGEQKRLVLEALLRGPDEVLLLDEPDNYLDVPGKRWLEEALRRVAQDRPVRQPRPRAAGPHGGPGGHRRGRHRLDPRRRLRDLPRGPRATGTSGSRSCCAGGRRSTTRLKDLVRTLQQQAAISPDMASRYHAMQTRLRKFEEAGPPQAPPKAQDVRMRLSGGRTGVRAVTCAGAGADRADAAVRPGGLLRRAGRGAGQQRLGQVALPAAAGRRAGRAHGGVEARRPGRPRALRPDPRARRAGGPAAAGRPVGAHARCSAGRRSRRCGGTSWTSRRSSPSRRCPAGSRRGSRSCCSSSTAPPCCSWTSRPTTSTSPAPRRSRTGWRRTTGTVLAVTHDRWFARTFDRFLVFGADGRVYEAAEPVWDEGQGRPPALTLVLAGDPGRRTMGRYGWTEAGF